MKTLMFNRLAVIFYLLLFSISAMAQSAEQTIRKAEESINKKMDELHQLAQQKKMYEAMAKLKEVYDEVENERKWGTFNEKFIEAKMKNPDFSFNIKSELPSQMSTEFWADFESKCDNILADQDVMIKGLKSEVNMNNWSKALAIGKQLKTLYETVTGIIENAGTGNLPKLVYDLNGNVNDFFGNIIELDYANVEALEIEAKKAKWNLTIAKAEKAKEKYNDFKHYIKTQKSLIVDFRVSVDYIDKIKQKTSSGPLAQLTYADNKYNWNYGPFQKDVTEACKDFETYDIKCEEFKKNFEEIKKEARADWTKVEANIIASDDNEKKREFLDYNVDRWTEFLGVVTPIFNKTYDKNCGVSKQAANSEDTKPKPKQEIKQEQQAKEEKKNENEDNNLFEGSRIQTKVEPEKKEPPKQSITPVKQSGSIDKYWENEIPANTDREWKRDIMDYYVRHQLNGRTVGFRRYRDMNFKYILNESVMDNFAIKHGASRNFSFDEKTGERWLSELSFYRANKKTGPLVNYFRGEIRSVNYYIDDVKLSEAEYRQKEKSDKSLVPYDVYKDSKWQNQPTEKNMPDPPVYPNSDHLSYHELKIPSEAVKFVNAHPDSDQKTIYYTETYYLPDYLNENVGERQWRISDNGVSILMEKIYLGRKGIIRFWDAKGQLKNLEFLNRDNYIDGINNNDREGGIKVGPVFSGGKISYKRMDGSDCTIDEYNDERKKYTQLPPSDIINSLKIQPSIAPNSHRDADGVNQDVTGAWIPNNSKIWRMNYYSNGSVQINYFLNHLTVGSHSWYDSKMTIPYAKSVRSQSLFLYAVSWFNDGELQSADIIGKLSYNHGRSIKYNDDRSIKWDSQYSFKRCSLIS